LDQVAFSDPAVPVISNVTGQPHGGASEIASRMVEQVTSSVLWEASMRTLLAQGFTRFIELGPGTALSGFLKRIDRQVPVLNVADLASWESTTEALKAGAPGA
jgi:[acyl-carrier-protein] S-malonyltransferase